MPSPRHAISAGRSNSASTCLAPSSRFRPPNTVEIVGLVGFDFVIIDQEHAPWDRAAVDIACLAARAVDIAAIVRVPEVNASSIMATLDCGATGVMVPHCDSPAKARAIAAACRHRGGVRGFATTTCAGGYGGVGGRKHMTQQDATVTCIAVIEDPAALDHLPEIAAVEGIDAFFIGRGDLGAALGGEAMNAAVRQITAVARSANMPTIALVSGREDARAMRDLGVAAFVHSNDHTLLKTAAAQAIKDYGDPAAW
jgi:2-keto-3-deoxy-L-rhamnonate aldolase RhmA